jgi:chromosome segregation ATPase
MLTFNSELFCRLLIGLLLGFLIHHKTYQNQLHTINQKIDQIIDKIEPRRKQFKNKTNQLTSDKQYSQEIENLWKDFKQLFDKKTELDPKFSFSEMDIEICELLGEGKGVATSAIKNFYQRKTNPRRKMIEAIQEWVNKEKKKKVESEDYEEDNEDTNINNN